MSAIRRAVLALGLVPVASLAWGADVTPEQAQQVQSELRTWIGTVLGPTIPVPDGLIQLTPAGDHFDVAIPLGTGAAVPKITATATPLGDGKWNIDKIRYPSPATFILDMPQSTVVNGTPQVVTGPVTYNLTLADQAGQILLDTTEKTPSTMNSSVHNMDLHLTGANMNSTSHLDQATSTSILRPGQNGRVSLLSDGTAAGYQITSTTPEVGEVKLSMDKARVTMELTDVSNQRAVQLIQVLAQMGAAMNAAGNAAGNSSGEQPATGPATPKAPPKLDSKQVSAMLEALADLASGASIQEQVDNLALSIAGQGGTLRQAQFGFQTTTSQGILQAHMTLGMEGLALPDLPLGDMATLIPTKVSLAPAVSGIAVADLVKIANDSQDGQDPPEADIAALFSHGGISAGLDSFSIDVGGSNITGLGKLLITSPDNFSGTAQIAATNLDLLQQRVAASPELAQAGPVFIFLKGIGRTAQNRMVWDVAFRDGRLLVNSQDLSAMLGMAPPPPAQGGTRPAPRPNQPRQ